MINLIKLKYFNKFMKFIYINKMILLITHHEVTNAKLIKNLVNRGYMIAEFKNKVQEIKNLIGF